MTKAKNLIFSFVRSLQTYATQIYRTLYGHACMFVPLGGEVIT